MNWDIFKIQGLIPKDRKLPMYWWSGFDNKNFGDQVGPYLAHKITGLQPEWVHRYYRGKHYLTAGSILWAANEGAIVWGSGIIKRDQVVKKPKEITAVRGPLTRKRLLELEIECPDIYGDPALLLSNYYRAKSEKKYKLGIIPHAQDYYKVKKALSNEKVLIINLCNPIEEVIEDINSCEKSVSSSLHGIIVSHAYGIPSAWIEFSSLAGDGVKFEDYFLSVGLEPYGALYVEEEGLNVQKLDEYINMHSNTKLDFKAERLLEKCPLPTARS